MLQIFLQFVQSLLHVLSVIGLCLTVDQMTIFWGICVIQLLASPWKQSSVILTVLYVVNGGAISGVLHQVRLKVVDRLVCDQSYKLLVSSQLCAGDYEQGGADACQVQSKFILKARYCSN